MKKKQTENYLEKIPMHAPQIQWSADAEGKITLEIENKGFWNRLFQKLFKKPKISFVHLEGLGHFVWPLIDGERTVLAIGELVDEQFGEAAKPLYERLVRYFQILDSYRFIVWKK